MELNIIFSAEPKTINKTISHLINNHELLDAIVYSLDGGVENCDISLSKEQLENIIDKLKERKRNLLDAKDDEDYSKELKENKEALDSLSTIYETFDFDNYTLLFYHDFEDIRWKKKQWISTMLDSCLKIP